MTLPPLAKKKKVLIHKHGEFKFSYIINQLKLLII